MAHSIQVFGEKSAILRDHVYAVIIVLAREVIFRTPRFEGFQQMAQQWEHAILYGVGMVDLKLEEWIRTEEEKQKYVELFDAIGDEAHRFGATIPGAFINERLPANSGWDFEEVDTEQILNGATELRGLISESSAV